MTHEERTRRPSVNNAEIFATRVLNIKPGLHIVVTIAEHVCDDAPMGIIKLSTYRLQIFLVKDQYL